MRRLFWLTAAFLLLVPLTPAALDRLCDTRYEDCRAPLLKLIADERQGIDVAFWFMEDLRYVDALIARHRAGVPVRVLVDPRASQTKARNAQTLDALKAAGIPMRMKAARSRSDILHWKMMLFAGQDVVEFSAANYTPYSFVPYIPYQNYIDEVVYFTRDALLTNSFRRRFEDLWTDKTGNIEDYANIRSEPQRVYGVFPIDPALNFPPVEDYAVRAVSRYDRETRGIDVIMFRVPDTRHADAMIRAKARGVPVRLIMEQENYRDSRFLWHAYNVDRMYAAGVQVKDRRHDGLTHQKSVVLRGLQETIFGSSNWSREAADEEEEHNLFTTRNCFSGRWCDADGSMFAFFAAQFDSKWNASSEYKSFVPLPPGAPVYTAPANGASGTSTQPVLTWQGGSWSHLYDIYLGTSASNLAIIARDVKVGGPDAGTLESFRVPSALAANTTYYWRIVGRTMARLAAGGPTWSFTTGGGSTPPGPTPLPEPVPPDAATTVLYAARTAARTGAWSIVADATAAGGARIHQPDRGGAKVTAPLPAPADYFELRFTAQAGVPYRLWMRGRAERDHYDNDSVWVQFSGGVNASGSPSWRIGSTSGIALSVEECAACGLSGWGWHDNGWGVGVRGEPVYFAVSGTQTLRVQPRQDGVSIDQIVLSPSTYFQNAPGLPKGDTTILPVSGGTPPAAAEVVRRAADVPSAAIAGDWQRVSDATAAGGIRLSNPDRGAAKIVAALAAPASYFDVTFNAERGAPYHLWLRMRAQNDIYPNDSVHVQFSGTVTSGGAPVYRIGTSASVVVSLEETSGAGVQGWGWNDNGWASLGANLYFAESGPQRLRVQVREDGVSIDQIVLSPARYLSTAPGALKNDTTILP